jgi:hypothetical protein
MNKYKIYKPGINRYLIKEFINDSDAASFANSYDDGWNWLNLGPIPQLETGTKIKTDTKFCQLLTNRFLTENRDAGITEPESIALLAQFKDILSMAQGGAVGSVYSLLQNVTVGTIYTQERKNRDLADLESYINNV